jgi:hypothetical protein
LAKHSENFPGTERIAVGLEWLRQILPGIPYPSIRIERRSILAKTMDNGRGERGVRKFLNRCYSSKMA